MGGSWYPRRSVSSRTRRPGRGPSRGRPVHGVSRGRPVHAARSGNPGRRVRRDLRAHPVPVGLPALPAPPGHRADKGHRDHPDRKDLPVHGAGRGRRYGRGCSRIRGSSIDAPTRTGISAIRVRESPPRTTVGCCRRSCRTDGMISFPVGRWELPFGSGVAPLARGWVRRRSAPRDVVRSFARGRFRPEDTRERVSRRVGSSPWCGSGVWLSRRTCWIGSPRAGRPPRRRTRSPRAGPTRRSGVGGCG